MKREKCKECDDCELGKRDGENHGYESFLKYYGFLIEKSFLRIKARREERMVEAEIFKFIEEHPDFEFGQNGKVHCKITGHDLPLRYADLLNYLETKKYKKAKEWYGVRMPEFAMDLGIIRTIQSMSHGLFRARKTLRSCSAS